MNFYPQRFNLYFLAVTVLALASGCVSDKKKAEKQLAGLRIHIENRANMAETSQTVTVLRSAPVQVAITPEAILTEANIISAALAETPGGIAVQVKFDETGSWTLEQFSASNPGRHFVIFGQWGEKMKDTRWLAAPLITHRNATGILTFTPDASREEAKQLVLGLNNSAKKYAKDK
jgi:preprotein translocase subunit SecD